MLLWLVLPGAQLVPADAIVEHQTTRAGGTPSDVLCMACMIPEALFTTRACLTALPETASPPGLMKGWRGLIHLYSWPAVAGWQMS